MILNLEEEMSCFLEADAGALGRRWSCSGNNLSIVKCGKKSCLGAIFDNG